jgi:hypothetical protein
VNQEGVVTLGDVIIIGGGCYGTFYARQLEAARAKKKARYRRLLVVDRNPDCQASHELAPDPGRELVVDEWGDFLDRYLAGAAQQPVAGSVIVPSPLMPHLMYQWLVRRAVRRWPERTVETRPIPENPQTPYDATAPDFTRYVSFADWICPTHCVEPALCPVIRGPRTWEMADAMALLTRKLNRTHPTAGPVLFQCQHTVFGVGTFGVADVLAGDQVVQRAGAGGESSDILVGTISSCHGAANLLHLGSTGNH